MTFFGEYLEAGNRQQEFFFRAHVPSSLCQKKDFIDLSASEQLHDVMAMLTHLICFSDWQILERRGVAYKKQYGRMVGESSEERRTL
jgi:hypothetical protein